MVLTPAFLKGLMLASAFFANSSPEAHLEGAAGAAHVGLAQEADVHARVCRTLDGGPGRPLEASRRS